MRIATPKIDMIIFAKFVSDMVKVVTVAKIVVVEEGVVGVV